MSLKPNFHFHLNIIIEPIFTPFREAISTIKIREIGVERGRYSLGNPHSRKSNEMLSFFMETPEKNARYLWVRTSSLVSKLTLFV
jgi:hypothetical protein